METDMTSTYTVCEVGSQIRAKSQVGRSLRQTATLLARAVRAYGIWPDIRILERQGRTRVPSPTPPAPATGFAGLAARVANAIAHELQVRRDTRKLMLMSDDMLKDIGVKRAEIARMVRYGRDGC
jgi:uncharacterized protein YjiS (DUF1127 family)